MTKEELINTVMPGGGHLVILGAGASKALEELKGGDKNGKKLPVMNELVSVLGLKPLLKKLGYTGATDDFELVYSELSTLRSPAELQLLNDSISDYFGGIEIPDELTNYDYLLAGLRARDVVATFNWDPLLVQSYDRLTRSGLSGKLPYLLFLHGNVAMGYCTTDKVSGPLKYGCSKCGESLTPTPLLYPVADKDYATNEYIKAQWEGVKGYMKHARLVTIYGYSAPATDVAAIKLLQEGWGKNIDRNFEQFELIIEPGHDEKEARDAWDSFIHTHHYSVTDDIMKSSIARTPRRTMELWFEQNLNAKFVDTNVFPKLVSIRDLVDWCQPLINAEDSKKTEDLKKTA